SAVFTPHKLNKSFLKDQVRIWHKDPEGSLWTHGTPDFWEDNGWDLTPLYESKESKTFQTPKKDYENPTHKDQVFYDPELSGLLYSEVKEKAQALGFKYVKMGKD